MVTYTEPWSIAFKTSRPLWKIWKYKTNILYILKKTNITAERHAHSTVISHFTQNKYVRSISG